MPSEAIHQQQPTKAKPKHAQHLAPFTVKDLRDAIPAHCFERSLIHSSAYLVVDLIIISAFVYAGYYFNTRISEHTSWPVAILFWNILWFCQGAVMTGVWIIGHECGHQSFSKWKSVNDTVGLFVHTALLVPYHNWRISHGIHHKNTSHMARDQVYVPKTFTQVHGNEHEDILSVIAESPLVALMQIIITVIAGWPLYLFTNAWGQDYGRRTNHFDPNAAMFKPSHKLDVMISNVGLVIMLGALTYLSMTFSFGLVFKLYVVPYFWTHFWFVVITYLQHTDVRVPHFRGEEWNFIRGALSTVDRDYGFLNIVHHHIADTHVAHHLFSQIPHYHAQEATEAIKKVLGDYYLADDTPVLKALWKAWRTCHYVDDDGDVLYYKTKDFAQAKNDQKKQK